MRSIHNFKIEGLVEGEIDLSTFAGKKLMIVNVASRCGYTPQYKQLQELYENFQDKLVIVGFPSNDFGGQEPGSAKEIQQFCTINYGVTFPLTQKVNITSTPIHPIYDWLTKKSLNGVSDSKVRWNFHKYLLDENGYLHQTFPSAVSPLDDVILNWVQA